MHVHSLFFLAWKFQNVLCSTTLAGQEASKPWNVKIIQIFLLSSLVLYEFLAPTDAPAAVCSMK